MSIDATIEEIVESLKPSKKAFAAALLELSRRKRETLYNATSITQSSVAAREFRTVMTYPFHHLALLLY